MRVVVGMSGGVDSSVAALLLQRAGYDVIGVTMQIWQEEQAMKTEASGGCCGLSAVEDARRVADKLGIPHYVMNFRDIFREKVIDYFTATYRKGRTPNPCIACNRYVKWESLLEKSLAIGAEKIATGHYAELVKTKDGRLSVKETVHPKGQEKDQTYALAFLTQAQLSHTLFPLAGHTKEAVRAIAEEANLPVAHKADSEEICFVPDDDYAGFIERETGLRDLPGNFVDVKGTVLGAHRGITHFTIGQRKRLGIALGKPVFVKEIRPETNEVVLADNEDLFTKRVRIGDLNPMGIASLEGEVPVRAKIRYNHAGAAAILRPLAEGLAEIEFEEAQRAATPGQAAVCYDDAGRVLLGGTIE